MHIGWIGLRPENQIVLRDAGVAVLLGEIETVADPTRRRLPRRARGDTHPLKAFCLTPHYGFAQWEMLDRFVLP
jgi:hypothetical protein